MSRRIKSADPMNDGSEGNWARGLPASVAGVPPATPVDYDEQAGCPRSVGGGTYADNVTGAPQPAPAPKPSPFKLGR